MTRITSLLALCTLLPFFALSQVGIGTITPNAQLDIQSSNQALPANTDGILIPKVDEFPATNPTVAQDGMMLYATGSGAPSKGFYFWNNVATSWVPLTTSVIDDAWYEESTTTVPDAITDDIYTMGNVAIGKNTADYPIDVLTTGSTGIYSDVTGATAGFSYAGRFINSRSGTGSRTGIDIDISSAGIISALTGIKNSVGDSRHNASVRGIFNVVGGSLGTSEGLYNQMGGTRDGIRKGVYNYIHNGGRGDHYGVHNRLTTSGSGNKYGTYSSILASAGGQHYGFYSEVLKVGGFAGYFLGNVSVGTTAANNYILPATRGAANQVIQTDGAGNLSWATPSSFAAKKINELTDGKSDDDGTQDGSSIFLGIGAGTSDDASDNMNVGIGYSTLQNNTFGLENTAIGYNSMQSNTSGQANTAIGHNALTANLAGYGNVGIGKNALLASDTAWSNVAIGVNSMNKIEDGDLNTAIGAESLSENISGSGNTAIGVNAGHNNVGDTNVFIGSNAGYLETGSDKLYIENSNADADNALIYGEFDTNILRANGTFQVGNPAGSGYALPNADGSINQVMQTDGAGNASWNTLSFADATTASNGLTLSTDDVRLGGTLTQATTFTHGANTITHNLTGIGDFIVQDGGSNHFEVRDNGNTYYGGDTYWNNGSTTGAQLARLSYAGTANNARFDVHKDALVQHRIASAETTVFNELGQDFDFRIEGDSNQNLFRTDAANNRVGIGTAVPLYTLDVAGDINTTGNIRQTGGAYSFPDYVFESYFEGSSEFRPEYRRKSLTEVVSFLKKNKHLPGVQSRADVAINGWNVTENVRSNLEKIEELYLYVIEADKKIKAQQQQLEELKTLVDQLLQKQK